MPKAQDYLNNLRQDKEQITSLNLASCNLTGELNLKGFTNLKLLNCEDNQITVLDVSDCPQLKHLELENNKALTHLYVADLNKFDRLISDTGTLEKSSIFGGNSKWIPRNVGHPLVAPLKIIPTKRNIRPQTSQNTNERTNEQQLEDFEKWLNADKTRKVGLKGWWWILRQIKSDSKLLSSLATGTDQGGWNVSDPEWRKDYKYLGESFDDYYQVFLQWKTEISTTNQPVDNTENNGSQDQQEEEKTNQKLNKNNRKNPSRELQNYYEILKIDQNANEEQIKQAYKRLSRQYHPDKASKNGLTTQEATEKFQELHAAYEELLKRTHRRKSLYQFGIIAIFLVIGAVAIWLWRKYFS